MAKHIKRFEMRDDYLDYILDSSFEPPLIAVCDELADESPDYSVDFITTTNIKIHNPENYEGDIYITDGHEIISSCHIGPILRSSVDSIPYIADAYYCWSIWGFGGGGYSTVRKYMYDDYLIYGYVEPSSIIDSSYFWENYCESNNVSKWSSPYEVAGYPENYNYPTVSMIAGDSDATRNYGWYNISEGDTVLMPLEAGYKLFPGSTITIITPTPE